MLKQERKQLIQELSDFGISIPYNRVLDIQANSTKQLCKFFQDNEVVCPPQLRSDAFTGAAIDNLDHNPSSSTARQAFHGTGISIFQFLKDEKKESSFTVPSIEDSLKTKITLPEYYHTLEPTKTSPVTAALQSTNTPGTGTSLI